ncbi:MAG: tRNA (adenosine(37)-N6)-threonylcarbamoyltransferase complex ATPase subunit type 1 TsaE [Gemmatimonadales bacterium]|nr:tRNA (adenosine(37)-N6)-threonylcarbamoyltransferase complex ATPase subunit type 1 TsaE [Gemmatimonadales bacterium]
MDPIQPSADDFSFLVTTDGPEGTADLGRRAASLLVGGEIILLYGDLGAGKTCFAQGLCEGLDVEEDVVSPTFTLVNTYQGRVKVHHLDFYRIEPGDDLGDIGVPDLLDEVWDGRAVALVEWPAVLLPEFGTQTPRLELLAEPGDSPSDRRWWLRGVPGTPPAWAELFDQKVER